MFVLILLLYGVPVYLVFFQFKLVPLTLFWKVFLWVPPAARRAHFRLLLGKDLRWPSLARSVQRLPDTMLREDRRCRPRNDRSWLRPWRRSPIRGANAATS